MSNSTIMVDQRYWNSIGLKNPTLFNSSMAHFFIRPILDPKFPLSGSMPASAIPGSPLWSMVERLGSFKHTGGFSKDAPYHPSFMLFKPRCLAFSYLKAPSFMLFKPRCLAFSYLKAKGIIVLWDSASLVGSQDINHAQFADDTILLGGASSQSTKNFKHELDLYQDASGSKINFAKSQIFGWNYNPREMLEISRILGIEGKTQWDAFIYVSPSSKLVQSHPTGSLLLTKSRLE